MVHAASEHAQVILSTQSPYLMDFFDLDDIHVVEPIQNENRIETQIRGLSSKDYQEWLEDYSPSELMDMKVLSRYV